MQRYQRPLESAIEYRKLPAVKLLSSEYMRGRPRHVLAVLTRTVTP
jgi:hypothetical protein